MTIRVACTNCGEDFRVRDEAAGKSFKCKACGTTIRIPDSEPEDYEPDEPDDFPERPKRSERPQKKQKKKKRRSSGSNETLWPAIGLYVTAGITFAYGLFNLAMTLTMGVNNLEEIPENRRLAFLLFVYGFTALGPIYNLIILVGAFCLHTRRAYPMAVIACIMAMIPCCSPCVVLGMPFGIWGLAVLFNEDV